MRLALNNTVVFVRQARVSSTSRLFSSCWRRCSWSRRLPPRQESRAAGSSRTATTSDLSPLRPPPPPAGTLPRAARRSAAGAPRRNVAVSPRRRAAESDTVGDVEASPIQVADLAHLFQTLLDSGDGSYRATLAELGYVSDEWHSAWPECAYAAAYTGTTEHAFQHDGRPRVLSSRCRGRAPTPPRFTPRSPTLHIIKIVTERHAHARFDLRAPFGHRAARAPCGVEKPQHIIPYARAAESPRAGARPGRHQAHFSSPVRTGGTRIRLERAAEYWQHHRRHRRDHLRRRRRRELRTLIRTHSRPDRPCGAACSTSSSPSRSGATDAPQQHSSFYQLPVAALLVLVRRPNARLSIECHSFQRGPMGVAVGSATDFVPRAARRISRGRSASRASLRPTIGRRTAGRMAEVSDRLARAAGCRDSDYATACAEAAGEAIRAPTMWEPSGGRLVNVEARVFVYGSARRAVLRRSRRPPIQQAAVPEPHEEEATPISFRDLDKGTRPTTIETVPLS